MKPGPKREARFRRSVWGASALYVCRACGKRTRETGDGESGCELCRDCYHVAGLENEHLDGLHADAPVADCPRCKGEARP